MKTICTKQVWLRPAVALILLAGLALALTGCQPPTGKVEATAVNFSTPYQAVLLSNNSVYFGKLSGYGTSNPVLTDVYYILSKTDPTTKQVQNVLVKRGKELHGPDRMYLNTNSIVFVEPVGTDSKVAQLIQEANQQK
jgi:small nuclear ribonucleoprotein (snRNP)-like protein